MIEDKLSVKTICQLTGINEHTLRAWERRYGVVKPRRLDNGRRVYSIEDLEKLKLIALLIRKGFLIGNVAAHDLQELSRLLNEAAQTPDMGDAAALQNSRAEEIVQRIEEALSRYNLITINVLLQQAKAEYGVREYLFQVVLPLMSRVGDEVARGEFSIGQEHALSALVKYHLLQLFYLLTHSHAMTRDRQAPKSFAVATAEGNLHEFGMLMAAVLCAFHGYPTCYLGPNLPAGSLAEASEAMAANCVVVGLPPLDDHKAANRIYMEDLLKRLPRVCEVWVGGVPHGEQRFPSERVRELPSLEELDRLLANIKRV
ncbi:MerR family transcriptional regulator [Oligoflexus tunisiensis]|uniref:MerR family transcriptional regulator n=1 Tax=Oligoflexus tunisiensis TaxID=708132 RepID=UPI00114CEBA9|nr:MerR family transcriptional regulator [Oligoflexus tunisiensis]